MSFWFVPAMVPPTPTSTPIQCSWCYIWGKFHFDATLNTAGNLFSNWIQTQEVNPTSIVCDVCNARGSPPHSEYLQKVTKWKIGELCSNVAEYAYGAFAKNSPTALAENRRISARPIPFARPLAKIYLSTPEAEIAASMSIGTNLMYIQNWLETFCPLCDPWNTTCRHRRPDSKLEECVALLCHSTQLLRDCKHWECRYTAYTPASGPSLKQSFA